MLVRGAVTYGRSAPKLNITHGAHAAPEAAPLNHAPEYLIIATKGDQSPFYNFLLFQITMVSEQLLQPVQNGAVISEDGCV